MNNKLAPTYQRMFGKYWVLWYFKSNNYSVIETEFKTLLDFYLHSDTLDEFSAKISSVDDVSDVKTVVNNLDTYLESCNASSAPQLDASQPYKTSKRHIERQYRIKDKLITIFYDTDLVEKTIHPSLAHLETNAQPKKSAITFDLYTDNGQLNLFKNQQLITSVPQRDYNLVQGKFIMQLLTVIHAKEESDWIGTFHGSTVSDGTNSVLFIGKSGKGKSTLCALLAARGFELLADDVSPMLSDNSHIYHNPTAISIKEGAFGTLQPMVPGFDDLPITLFNTTKGSLKHIPTKSPNKDNYPCKAIIMVNYEPNSKTQLESASVKEILETLIPDSWLSNHPKHAEQFLDWLVATPLYQITYSDTERVIETISAVFNGLEDKY